MTTSLRWPDGGGGLDRKIGEYNRSPDLAPLLQILDQNHGLGGTLPTQSALQFWLRGDFEGGSAEVATPFYGAPDDHPAKLVYKHCD